MSSPFKTVTRCVLAMSILLLPLLARARADTRLLRQPTLSDRDVAFAYGGDLWVATSPEAPRDASPAPRPWRATPTSRPTGS
jgi:hypothetical protein